jgi:tRNA uridine 5-carbamoylmethylation protein Kti12
MKIILLSGKMGSGKTTTADELAAKLTEEHYVYRTRFAKKLYQLHDMVRDEVRKLGVDAPSKSRILLQFLGTEYGRALDENIWVKAFCKDVKEAEQAELKQVNGRLTTTTEKPDYVIADDLRFVNEFYGPEELIKSGAATHVVRIRLECAPEIRAKRCSTELINESHPSETSLDHMIDKFDLVVNTGKNSVQETVNQIYKYITSL